MMISSELQNIFLPNLVWWYSKMSQSVMRNKDCLLSSRSRSQRGFIWSKYDSFYYILWTVDTLATKLGLMLHYHKPECLVKKKNWFTIVNVVTVRTYVIKIALFLLYLPNCCSVCNQTWCDVQYYKPECPAKKIGLLRRRSRLNC